MESSIAQIKKIKFINYTQIIIFSLYLIYFLTLQFSNFSLEFNSAARFAQDAWNRFSMAYIFPIYNDPINIYILFPLLQLLLPIYPTALLLLIALKRDKTKISPFMYFLLSVVGIYIFSVKLYVLTKYNFPIDKVILLFDVLLIVTTLIPALMLGYSKKETMVKYNDSGNKLLFIPLLPLWVVKKTFDFAETKKKSVFLYSVILIFGLNIAAKLAELMYEVILFRIVLPYAIVTIVWSIAIVVVLFILYKLFLAPEKNTVVTRERSSVLRGKYLSHEVNGKEVATTYKQKGVLSDYNETTDKDGNVIATSREREGILKGNYIEHQDSNGNIIATSQERDTILGEEIVHRDKDEKVIGTSKNFNGVTGDYTKTTKKE